MLLYLELFELFLQITKFHINKENIDKNLIIYQIVGFLSQGHINPFEPLFITQRFKS